MDAFWTAPAARRGGLGLALASHVVAAHPGPWAIAFQHDNTRRAAASGGGWPTELFGPEGDGLDRGAMRPVPGKPEVPPDHWIETAL